VFSNILIHSRQIICLVICYHLFVIVYRFIKLQEGNSYDQLQVPLPDIVRILLKSTILTLLLSQQSFSEALPSNMMVGSILAFSVHHGYSLIFIHNGKTLKYDGKMPIGSPSTDTVMLFSRSDNNATACD